MNSPPTPLPTPSTALLIASRFAWILPLEGITFAWLRIHAQGGSDTYTQLNKQFYVEGGLTGWQLAPDTYLWLGKDALILLTLSLLCVAAFGWLAHRLSRSPKSPTSKSKAAVILAALAVLGAAPSLAAPLLWAVPKLPPPGAQASLPTSSGASADARPGSFPQGVAGRYVVIPYSGNLITAQLRAGGDTFETKFTDTSGDATFDPTRLDAPIAASFSASVQSISTGIGARDNHARDYLKASQHPTIGLSFTKLTHNTIEPSGDTVHFDADATLSMMGQSLPATVKGSLKALSPDAVRAAGLPDAPTFSLDASLSLPLKLSPLAPHADDFDQPDLPIPIRATLLLQLQ